MPTTPGGSSPTSCVYGTGVSIPRPHLLSPAPTPCRSLHPMVLVPYLLQRAVDGALVFQLLEFAAHTCGRAIVEQSLVQLFQVHSTCWDGSGVGWTTLQAGMAVGWGGPLHMLGWQWGGVDHSTCWDGSGVGWTNPHAGMAVGWGGPLHMLGWQWGGVDHSTCWDGSGVGWTLHMLGWQWGGVDQSTRWDGSGVGWTNPHAGMAVGWGGPIHTLGWQWGGVDQSTRWDGSGVGWTNPHAGMAVGWGGPLHMLGWQWGGVDQSTRWDGSGVGWTLHKLGWQRGGVDYLFPLHPGCAKGGRRKGCCCRDNLLSPPHAPQPPHAAHGGPSTAQRL